jgi:hypothetical protein
MKSLEIEAWALRIIDAVKNNAPHEDSRAECKMSWIPPKKAARRLAAHANAAGGEPILWLVGLERNQGIVGASQSELSNWWSSVQSEFNEVSPTLTDLLIPVGAKTVVALLIDTDRAPFVVKAQDGYLEVPWREGTKTNSARRSDLVRLLAPTIKLPHFEVMGGSVELHQQKDEPRYFWKVRLDGYILPRDERRVVFPFHYAHMTLKGVGPRPIGFVQPTFHLPVLIVRGAESPSVTLRLTNSEMIVDGAGSFTMASEGHFLDPPTLEGEAELTAYLRPAASSVVAVMKADLTKYDKVGTLMAWAAGPRFSDMTFPWPNKFDI